MFKIYVRRFQIHSWFAIVPKGRWGHNCAECIMKFSVCWQFTNIIRTIYGWFSLFPLTAFEIVSPQTVSKHMLMNESFLTTFQRYKYDVLFIYMCIYIKNLWNNLGGFIITTLVYHDGQIYKWPSLLRF